MHDEKLYIVMVGLPARGKSTLAIGLQDAFRKNRISTRIFNNGNLMGGRNDRRLRARLLVTPAVFPFMIDVKTMDIVFDRRHPIASPP